MDGPVTEHRFLNPDQLLAGQGFSHVAVPGEGRTVYLAGQTAHQRDGTLKGGTVAEQAEAALANLVVALAAADAQPADVVAIQIYVTDVAGYRDSLHDIGRSWRTYLGKHYPAVSLFGVTELFDPDAKIEIVATAVVTPRA